MKIDEGVVKTKRTNVNAKLPIRGMAGLAGYDLAMAEAAVVPAHGKCLVKTGLSMALPPDCYGKTAPRSGLVLKQFVDVGPGVIDSDYRGELDVILFNFGDEDFILNMGDRIAQLIFEKINTPIIKETNSLEESGWGAQGYGSTYVSAKQPKIIQAFKNSIINQSNKSKTQETDEGNQMDVQSKNEAIPDDKNKRSQLEKTRQIISARQLQKLAKDDSPVFLAIVRANDSPKKRYRKRGKRFQSCAAKFAAAHGSIEGQKRQINKQTGPKKDFVSVEENNRFSPVSLKDTGKTWNYSLMSTEMSVQKSCRRVYLPHERYNM